MVYVIRPVNLNDMTGRIVFIKMSPVVLTFSGCTKKQLSRTKIFFQGDFSDMLKDFAVESVQTDIDDILVFSKGVSDKMVGKEFLTNSISHTHVAT